MPSQEQQRNMRRFADSCRLVYNKAQALQNAIHEAGNKFIDHEKMANFFDKRTEYPRFKKRGQGDSFRFPQGLKLDQENCRVFLPRLGSIRYGNNRDVLGTVGNITFSGRNNKWLVSIQTSREVAQPIAHVDAVGIDMGVARFATLSDGAFVRPMNLFKPYAGNLGKAQQALSRTKKYRKNWKKAKTRIPCPGCGEISKENRKRQAQFACVECGFSENACLAGAINISKAGYAQIACRVNCDLSGQQEPTEVAA